MRRHPSVLLGAFTLMLASLGALPSKAQTWTPIGPAPLLDAGVENIVDQPVAGAIEALAAHPTNPNTLWIGSVNGGVFRTDNATAASPTWVAQTDDQPSLSIGALELDPTDLTHSTLVAGLGSLSSFRRDGGASAGLLRTTDGGTTWTSLPALSGREITGVAPRGSILIAANAFDNTNSCTGVGIARSTDGGATFAQISNNPGVTGLPCGRAFDLAGDPTDPSRLFAPITHLGGPSDGIYRSTDTGATWTKVSSPAMDALLSAFPSRVEISVGRSGGANANVYVAICDTRLAGLFRSGNGGTTWTALDLPTTMEGLDEVGIHPGQQCSLHLSMVADPTNPQVVFLGGDRQPGPLPNSVGALAFVGRLFRVDASQPAGSQATPITHCASAALPGCRGSARTANGSAPHADSREMVFDANGQLIEADDGGVYRHTNPNGPTGDWVSVIGNLSAIEQHDSALDTVSDIVLSGNQDNGTALQPVPGATIWTEFFGGDGGDVVVAPDDPMVGQSTRYMSAQNFGSALRTVFNTANGLVSFAFLTLSPLAGAPAPTFQFTTPIAVDSDDPARLILGAANGTYESLDRLDSVTRISTAVVNSGGTGPIAYGVPGNSDVVYFGSADKVFVRTAAPPATPVSSDPDPGTDSIVGVVIDPADAATAFAIDTNQVFRTTDSAATWSEISGNLGALSPGRLRSLEYLPGSVNRLVVGSNKGVFVASETNGFAVWARLGDGIPNVPIFDLDYDASGNRLVAGTLGRGAWTLTPNLACVPDPFEPDSIAGQAAGINPGDPQTHSLCPAGDLDWVTFSLATTSEVVLETSGPTGDTVLTLFDSLQNPIEENDDSGIGLFSRIDRTCAFDPLPAGTYLARVRDFGVPDEIATYDLSLTASSCCPDNLVLSNAVLSGSQTFSARLTATLGPNLVIQGAPIEVVAGNLIILASGTTIGGSFVATIDAGACP